MWWEDMTALARTLCAERETFTSDDLWRVTTISPYTPRIMGPLLQSLVRARIAEPLPASTKGTRRRHHPLRVWRSLLYVAPIAAERTADEETTPVHPRRASRVSQDHEPDGRRRPRRTVPRRSERELATRGLTFE